MSGIALALALSTVSTPTPDLIFIATFNELRVPPKCSVLVTTRKHVPKCSLAAWNERAQRWVWLCCD